MKTRRKWFFEKIKQERDIGLLGNECRFLVKTIYMFQSKVYLIHYFIINPIISNYI
jgi:hypothetical protein